MTKEDYSRLGLCEGKEVSFYIRAYRILKGEGEPLSAEIQESERPSFYGEGI
jgi:hypothetical protein